MRFSQFSIGELRDFCYRYRKKAAWLRQHARSAGTDLEISVTEDILCKGTEDRFLECELARQNKSQASAVWLWIELEHITTEQMVYLLAACAKVMLTNGYFVLNDWWFKIQVRRMLKKIHDIATEIGHCNYVIARDTGAFDRAIEEMPDAHVPADDDILVDDDEDDPPDTRLTRTESDQNQ